MRQKGVLLALWALVHPGSGSVSNGSGVGAPSDTHCAKRPSLHPWDEIHEEEVTEAIKKKTVMVQHVNAITCKNNDIIISWARDRVWKNDVIEGLSKK